MFSYTYIIGGYAEEAHINQIKSEQITKYIFPSVNIRVIGRIADGHCL